MHDIKTTLIFAAGSALLLNLVGLAYALLMNSDFRGKSIVRVIIYLPAIISPLIMGYIWFFLLQPGRGFLFYAFQQLNLPDLVGSWMSSYPSALLVLVLVNVWQFSGMTMIIYLAGLQSIPTEINEAALIDGANAWQRFKSVTIPMLMPAIRNQCGHQRHRLALGVRRDHVADRRRSGICDREPVDLYHAHVLRQPHGLFHGCCDDSLFHHPCARADFHAADAAKNLRREQAI